MFWMGCGTDAFGVAEIALLSCHISFAGATKKFLQANPKILSPFREFDFFVLEKRYGKGLDAYRNLMPLSRQDQVTLEGSPNYWYTLPQSARRIYAMDPCVKLIVIVINPIDLIASYFAQVSSGNASEIYQDGKRVLNYHDFVYYPNGTVRTNERYIEVGFYAKHMKRWRMYFPSERILVVDGLVMKRRPWVELRKIEGFLGVPQVFNKSQFYLRSDGRVWCHEKVRCLPPTEKGRTHPHVSPADRKNLSDYFKDSNEEFFGIIGRRLKWADEL